MLGKYIGATNTNTIAYSKKIELLVGSRRIPSTLQNAVMSKGFAASVLKK